MGGTARTLSYLYNSAGNRTHVIYPDALYARTWYDALGRPYYLTVNDNFGIAYSHYKPHGGLWVVNRDNGSATAIEYDDVQRPDVMAHNFASPGNGANVYWTFDRNPASQLTGAFRNNDLYAWTRHYGLDRAYATNGLNQYEQTASGGVPTATFDYDDNVISDGTNTFGYDIENRLVSRSGGVALSYDPLGRLFSVTSPSMAMRWPWSITPPECSQ